MIVTHIHWYDTVVPHVHSYGKIVAHIHIMNQKKLLCLQKWDGNKKTTWKVNEVFFFFTTCDCTCETFIMDTFCCREWSSSLMLFHGFDLLFDEARPYWQRITMTNLCLSKELPLTRGDTILFFFPLEIWVFFSFLVIQGFWHRELPWHSKLPGKKNKYCDFH